MGIVPENGMLINAYISVSGPIYDPTKKKFEFISSGQKRHLFCYLVEMRCKCKSEASIYTAVSSTVTFRDILATSLQRAK
jgi:hypothetical protein